MTSSVNVVDEAFVKVMVDSAEIDIKVGFPYLNNDKSN